MLDYDHPHIRLEEPHPGYFVAHYPPAPFPTADGIIVPPGQLIIPPEIPASLLRHIADQKEHPTSAPPPSQRIESAPIPTTTTMTTTTTSTSTSTDADLPARIQRILTAATRRLRLADLSTILDLPEDQLRPHAGQTFLIGRSGWLSLAAPL